MWGDNEATIKSATSSDARLNKLHIILSFHFVRNIIDSKYLNLQPIRSKFNIADVVNKHWFYQSVHKGILKPVFYFEGDTGHLFEDYLLYVNKYINIKENDVLVIDGEW